MSTFPTPYYDASGERIHMTDTNLGAVSTHEPSWWIHWARWCPEFLMADTHCSTEQEIIRELRAAAARVDPQPTVWDVVDKGWVAYWNSTYNQAVCTVCCDPIYLTEQYQNLYGVNYVLYEHYRHKHEDVVTYLRLGGENG